MSTTIESDRNASAIQTIAAEVLGVQVGVTQAGRLGNEITFNRIDGISLDALVAALGANGHAVEVTRTQGPSPKTDVTPLPTHNAKFNAMHPAPAEDGPIGEWVL